MVLIYAIISEFWFIHFMNTISLIDANTGKILVSNNDLKQISKFYIILYFLSISWIISIPILFLNKKK